MLDVPFLRGRAEVYRRMAGSTASGNSAAEFVRLAVDCEEQAVAIEKDLPPVRVSIRRHPRHPLAANSSRRPHLQRSA